MYRYSLLILVLMCSMIALTLANQAAETITLGMAGLNPYGFGYDFNNLDNPVTGGLAFPTYAYPGYGPLYAGTSYAGVGFAGYAGIGLSGYGGIPQLGYTALSGAIPGLTGYGIGVNSFI